MSNIIDEIYYSMSLRVAKEIHHEMVQDILTDKVKKSNKKRHRRWRAIEKAGRYYYHV